MLAEEARKLYPTVDTFVLSFAAARSELMVGMFALSEGKFGYVTLRPATEDEKDKYRDNIPDGCFDWISTGFASWKQGEDLLNCYTFNVLSYKEYFRFAKYDQRCVDLHLVGEMEEHDLVLIVKPRDLFGNETEVVMEDGENSDAWRECCATSIVGTYDPRKEDTITTKTRKKVFHKDIWHTYIDKFMEYAFIEHEGLRSICYNKADADKVAVKLATSKSGYYKLVQNVVEEKGPNGNTFLTLTNRELISLVQEKTELIFFKMIHEEHPIFEDLLSLPERKKRHRA